MTGRDAQNSLLAALSGNPLRYELVEIPVEISNLGQAVFSFPTNQNLQGKRILYVDAFCVETVATSPFGIPVISVATYKKAFLDLYSTPVARENIRKLPFISLNPHFVPGGTAPNVQERILINNVGTDWNKCQVYIPGGIGGETKVSILLGVWYIDA